MIKGILSERNVSVLAFTGVMATSSSMLILQWMSLYKLARERMHLSILTSVGWGLGGEAGGPMEGPAWQALKADLVPPKDRGKVLGFFATIAVSTGLPAPVVGGYLYRLNPAQPFLVSVLLSLISLLAVYFFVKEPKVNA